MPNSNVNRFTDPYTHDLSLPLFRRSSSRALQRRTTESMEQVVAEGAVAATYVDSADYVADRALRSLGVLSDLEADLAARNPHAAERLQAIVDTFTTVALGEVASLRRGGNRRFDA